jgi:hypothetical protein
MRRVDHAAGDVIPAVGVDPVRALSQTTIEQAIPTMPSAMVTMVMGLES